MNCENCKKEYEVRRPYLKGVQKCCSYKCAGEIKRTRVIKKCLICDSDFDCDPCRVERHKYCSRKCQYEAGIENNSGDKNPAWKGGTYYVKKYLYVKSPNHPNRNSGGYVAQHRLVMEDKLGRYLTPNEQVHHKNQVKDDNRIENLEVVVKSAHFGKVTCPHCEKSFKLK